VEVFVEDVVARGDDYATGAFEGGCDLLVEEIGLDLHTVILCSIWPRR
jgi:hypothetical protein